MTSRSNEIVRGQIRAVTLLEAAERASLTPIKISQLHALAYLTDVLSPIWGLDPFDRVALKTSRTPFFAKFQGQLDSLVIQGLVEVSEYGLVGSGADVSQASVSFRYLSPHLAGILDHIAADPEYSEVLEYCTQLAVAMSRMSDAAIGEAVSFDASWENPNIPAGELIELAGLLGGRTRTATEETIEMFDSLKNRAIKISPAAKLRLYATYLSERLRVA